MKVDGTVGGVVVVVVSGFGPASLGVTVKVHIRVVIQHDYSLSQVSILNCTSSRAMSALTAPPR